MRNVGGAHVAKPIRAEDYQNLLKAAKALLAKIDDITTEDFSKGAEREEREALRVAILKAEPH
jgi:hypothetical protein